MKRLLHLTLLLALGGGSVASQPSVEFKQIFASDSLAAGFAMTSPDGKWLVFTVPTGYAAASLWIAPTSGGAPIPLTSSGYNDEQPVWFASGDKVEFMSTRPNRNGARQSYLMTLEIDPATGRARGAPRQVTSEPVTRGGPPSPDGRWLPYVSAGTQELKVVPANGGAARTLTRLAGPILGLDFSPDGRTLYFTDDARVSGTSCAGDECRWVIRRVSMDGGAPQVVTSAPHPIRVIGRTVAPHVLHHFPPQNGEGARLEVRDASGRTVVRAQMPRGMRMTSGTNDGYSVLAVRAESDYSARVVPVVGGPVRTLISAGRQWVEGWMPDGSALITGGSVERRAIDVGVTPLDGSARRRLPLQANTSNSGGRSDVGPWHSFQAGSPASLHAINVLTGETRAISGELIQGPIGLRGRGGLQQDGPNWIYVERAGTGAAFRSTSPATGATETIRIFPEGLGDRRLFAAHGTSLVWFEARGSAKDVMLSDGPTATPRRIATLQDVDDEENLRWSWRGDRLAVCGRRANDRATILSVLTVPALGATTGATRQDFELGAASSCWGPQWLPDDSGLIMMIIADRQNDVPDLAHLALTDGSRPRILSGDDPDEIWEFIISPDGRSVAYPVGLPANRSSIHVASFKALIGARR